MPVAVSSEIVFLHVAIAELAYNHAVVHIVGALDDLRPEGAVGESASGGISHQQTQHCCQQSTGTHSSGPGQITLMRSLHRKQVPLSTGDRAMLAAQSLTATHGFAPSQRSTLEVHRGHSACKSQQYLHALSRVHSAQAKLLCWSPAAPNCPVWPLPTSRISTSQK